MAQSDLLERSGSRLPSRTGWIALLLLASSLLTCGGAWITIDLVIAAGERPFEGVKTVRLEVSGAAMESISAAIAYQSGAEIELPWVPPGQNRVVTVEGIDADGVVIARGASSPFEVTGSSPERTSVPFAACTTSFFRDADGDGHGDRLRSKRACPSAGWVAIGDDCNDANRDVYPGQTQYFGQSQFRSPPGPGSTKPFDYDCDGVETPKLGGTLVACVKSPPDCVGAGWRGSTPGCGESGTFVECEKKTSECVESVGTSVQQTCR